MEEKQEFIPIVTINNKREKKEVEVEGVKQEVELPAQEGFNIESKGLDGDFSKSFFVKELSGVILFDRYQIQSKYTQSDYFMSNEFEFSGPRNNVRVYSPSTKEVLYEGDYDGVKEKFVTGETTKFGTPAKMYDTFAIIYFMTEGQILRFKWKLNQNNNWFDYKDNTKEDKESRKDNHDYRGINTSFALSKKKFGTNDFWICTLQNSGKVDRAEADIVATDLIKKLDAKYNAEKTQKKEDLSEMAESLDDGVNVAEIPF